MTDADIAASYSVGQPALRLVYTLKETIIVRYRHHLTCFLLMGLWLLTSGVPTQAAAPAPEPGMTFKPAQGTDWREEYAYSLGIQAYIFGYPWVYLPALRWQWTNKFENVDTAYAPINQFWHAPRLLTADWRDGGTMNNDTLYSLAWVDLRKEPVILSVPDMGKRYYTMEMVGMNSDNFAYVGQRATGNKAGSYALIGPGWKGKLPAGVKALPASPSSWALVFGRTLAVGDDDVPAVHALQQKYQLTPLSLWGKAETHAPESRDVWKPFDEASDPLAHWKTMNRAMAEDAMDPRHALLLQSFAGIGVGPGLDVDKVDPATKRGLVRAAREGWRILNASPNTNYHMKTVAGGWRYPPSSFGRTSNVNDFLVRGGLQCLIGITANDPEEAVYLNTASDAKNQRLHGDKRYVMHFGPKDLPDVKAFWSLTMYGFDRNFIANTINRYSLGDRSPTLKKDADGGVSLWIQADTPGPEKEGNWLPSPKGNPFYLVLRGYVPGAGMLEQTWVPPAVTEITE